MDNRYEYQTYDMARFHIKDGMYSIAEVEDMLEYMKQTKRRQDRMLKESVQIADDIEQAEKQEPVAWMKNESFVDADNLWDVRVTFNQDGDGIPLYLSLIHI